jgi:hypothetical protein
VLTSTAPHSPDDDEVPEAVVLLDRTAQHLHDAAGHEDVSADAAATMRRLADDLSSHALAARVLAASGASAQAVEGLVRRAVDLVDDAFPGATRSEGSATATPSRPRPAPDPG